MEPNSAALLECSALSAGYGGVPVVEDISFSVRAGELLCIAGPNGCGKSTLLKALAAILPYRGSVRICGAEARGLTRNELGKRRALLSQFSGAYFSYTVYDTVALARYAHARGFFKTLTRQDADVVAQTLAGLELDGIQHKALDELSGGQLQRVFLARAIAQSPKLILLDEPTNHLDLPHQLDILRYLSGWVREGERAVIGVLHDLNLALEFFPRTMLMGGGRTTACGQTKELFTGPDDALNALYRLDVRRFMLSSLSNWR